jgi:rhodanese-related sulfurtransferase
MRQGLSVSILLCLAAFLAFSCAAGGLLAPIPDVTADQLHGMIARKAPVVLVDTRSEYEYRKDHLPGAILIPPYRFNDLNTLLPADKGAELVFYCRGVGCEQSKEAAAAASKLGYVHVSTFTGGYPAWKAKGYSLDR